jgi:hypothetical protein
MKKNKKLIPKGLYCYSGSCAPGSKTFKLCPYWSSKKNRPEQENGYCSYLGKGDWEINREKKIVIARVHQKDGSYKEVKEKYGPDRPSFFGILFDMCKECSVNMDDEYDK